MDLELQIKDKVKFRSVYENLVKTGLIKDIIPEPNHPDKYVIRADDGELYLNVHRDDIISFLGFGPPYMADECDDKEAELNYEAGVEYHIGDCVYLEHKSDEGIKGDFIITYILGNKIELLSLTGIHYFVYKENVKITANIGPIFIPGVGYSQTVLFNKGKIDTDAFMYRLGDIVTAKATKRVGKIADAYFSRGNECIAYKIDYFDSNEDEYIVWQPYTNIEPGDYRMKELTTNCPNTEYKRGDCVYLINDPMNVHDHVIITAIYSDNTIGVIDLLGRVNVLNLSNTFIKRNFGNIIIPGFGEVNETRIPVFDDFKYHYGDIVTYNGGPDKYVGRIESGIHIDTDLYPSSIDYQIINIDSSINALRNYNEIEPGDYRMKESTTNCPNTEYKRGDCVHIRSMHSKSLGNIMMDGIVLSKSDTTIALIDLIGNIHTFHSSEMIITANFGNIDLPGFGIVDCNNIPNPSDFKYRLGDIVSVADDDKMKVGQISRAMYSVTDSCVKYLVQLLNKYDEPGGIWVAFENIIPGDYRMKEQENNKITIEDNRNCFDDDFVVDDDKCDAEEDYRFSCSYQDKIGCPVEIFTGPLAPLQSFKDIFEIRFDKPEITIVYSNGGESNVELPKNAYNKKVGFLLAYLKGILDDIEYARVIGVMKSINKDPQQIIVNLEKCNEDD